MSGKMFKKKVGKGKTEKGASYKRGQPGPELDLATKVAKLYLSGRLTEKYNGAKPRDSFDRSLGMILESLDGYEIGDMDPHLFLEMAIQKISQTTEHTKHTHCLIDPLVQALYLNGLNDFSIDLSPLPLWPVYCGSFLTGDGDNQLTASYVGKKVNQFAYDSTDSVLRLKANALTVGHKSTSVVVKSDGKSGSVGWRGNGCDYEIIGSKAIINPYENHNCVFRVESFCVESDAAYDGDLKTLQEIGFFRRGNTILVPDGKGGWEEVVPR